MRRKEEERVRAERERRLANIDPCGTDVNLMGQDLGWLGIWIQVSKLWGHFLLVAERCAHPARHCGHCWMASRTFLLCLLVKVRLKHLSHLGEQGPPWTGDTGSVWGYSMPFLKSSLQIFQPLATEVQLLPAMDLGAGLQCWESSCLKALVFLVDNRSHRQRGRVRRQKTRPFHCDPDENAACELAPVTHFPAIGSSPSCAYSFC